MSQTLVNISHIKEGTVASAIDDTATILSLAGFNTAGTQSSSIIGAATRKLTIATAANLITETASGTDSNISVSLISKGTGGVLLKGATAGTASVAGNVGEAMGDMVFGTATTATVTLTQANPGVITWTAHGFSTAVPQPVVFTTSGALPTNITAATVYWTVPSSVTTNTFQIATTVANAFVPTPIDTTAGSNTGTQTGTAGTKMATGTAINVTGLNLTAGDWDVWGEIVWNANAATTWTLLEGSISQTSATLATSGAIRGTSYSSLSQISAAATNGVSSILLPPTIINISATTPVYLVVKGAFATNILGAYGNIMARRRT